ncbi:MAG: AcrR family transcriptional regulator [Myxococcota bacterium]|jgi:AcrR family transcriptional regulator
MPKATFFNLEPSKRARLVDAAIVEFAKTLPMGGSLDRIAAAAGISKGSLYPYFDNKVLDQNKLTILAADPPC